MTKSFHLGTPIITAPWTGPHLLYQQRGGGAYGSGFKALREATVSLGLGLPSRWIFTAFLSIAAQLTTSIAILGHIISSFPAYKTLFSPRVAFWRAVTTVAVATCISSWSLPAPCHRLSWIPAVRWRHSPTSPCFYWYGGMSHWCSFAGRCPLGYSIGATNKTKLKYVPCDAGHSYFSQGILTSRGSRL